MYGMNEFSKFSKLVHSWKWTMSRMSTEFRHKLVGTIMIYLYRETHSLLLDGLIYEFIISTNLYLDKIVSIKFNSCSRLVSFWLLYYTYNEYWTSDFVKHLLGACQIMPNQRLFNK